MDRKRHASVMFTATKNWRKDPNIPSTLDNYGFIVNPTILVRELSKLGNDVRCPPNSSKPNPTQSQDYGVIFTEIMDKRPVITWH